MNKTVCSYCGGETTDDSRGNCAACGAPRQQDHFEAIQQALLDANRDFDAFLNNLATQRCQVLITVTAQKATT